MDREGSETREIKLWKTPVKMVPENGQVERKHAQLSKFLHQSTVHLPSAATLLRTKSPYTILDPLSESQESLSHPSGRAGIMGGGEAEGKCPIFQTGVSKSEPCNLSSLGLVAQGPKQRALLRSPPSPLRLPISQGLWEGLLSRCHFCRGLSCIHQGPATFRG